VRRPASRVGGVPEPASASGPSRGNARGGVRSGSFTWCRRCAPLRRPSPPSAWCAKRAARSRRRAPPAPSARCYVSEGASRGQVRRGAGTCRVASGAGRWCMRGSSGAARGRLSPSASASLHGGRRHAAPPACRARGPGGVLSGRSHCGALGLPNKRLKLTARVGGVPGGHRPPPGPGWGARAAAARYSGGSRRAAA
jgi:hypothetical protein